MKYALNIPKKIHGSEIKEFQNSSKRKNGNIFLTFLSVFEVKVKDISKIFRRKYTLYGFYYVHFMCSKIYIFLATFSVFSLNQTLKVY